MALTNKLSAIGDAIREKTGKTELLTLDAMPVAILSIETGGEMKEVVISGSQFEQWILTGRYTDDSGNMYVSPVDYYNDWITEIRQSNCFSAMNAKTITLPNLEKHYTLRNSFFANNPTVEEIHAPKLQVAAANCFKDCNKLKFADFPVMTEVKNNAFSNCYKVEYINLPSCTTVWGSAFENCNALTSVNLSACETLGNKAFYQCTKIESISFPMLKELSSAEEFYSCTALKKLDFGVLNAISCYSWNSPFYQCSAFETLILRSSSVVSASSDMAAVFNQTKIKSGSTGYIYVPSALIEDYKVATNWATLASRFRAIEDYPEICG